MTDAVKPVINTNSIKNIVLIAFILRFETFNFESSMVTPISKKFTCVPDTAKMWYMLLILKFSTISSSIFEVSPK